MKKESLRTWLNKRKSQISPTRMIAIVFAVIILVGALLLTLPAASRSGVSCGFRPALFTATSATCVTGLVMFDTWTQWSLFGQIVILCMIEVGGLGFMSAASLVIFFLRKKVGLRQRMVMAQALSVNDMDAVVRLQRLVIYGSMLVQLVGAVILMLRFFPWVGWGRAAWWGVFHSVTAFCNAGFDIFGFLQPGTSVMVFNQDPVVLLTLGTLVAVGGLGFFVWEEVLRLHSWRKYSVYTKLVLLTSLSLIVIGAVMFGFLEWKNPATIGRMSVGGKILNCLFQSLSTRTAGYAAVDQALMTDGGKVLTMVLMLIGGSSGSTAGGIKTVTLVVLALFLWARVRGRRTVSIYKRTIPENQVLDAMTIVGVMVGLAVLGGVVICATSPIGFTDALFEAVSALATVGLTAGTTTQLSIPAQILMILYMYFGRVGILTISLGFLMGNKAEERYRYAHTNLLIG